MYTCMPWVCPLRITPKTKAANTTINGQSHFWGSGAPFAGGRGPGSWRRRRGLPTAMVKALGKQPYKVPRCCPAVWGPTILFAKSCDFPLGKAPIWCPVAAIPLNAIPLSLPRSKHQCSRQNELAGPTRTGHAVSRSAVILPFFCRMLLLLLAKVLPSVL